MATLTATGTLVEACGADNYIWSNYGYNNNRFYIGISQGTKYTVLIKFKTPNFVGTCNNVFLRLPTTKFSASNTTKSLTVNYAISSSDTYKGKYAGRTAAVDTSADPDQLVSGQTTVPNLSTNVTKSGKFEINASDGLVSSIKPNTTYYLYLWPSSSTSGRAATIYWYDQGEEYQTIKVTYDEPDSGVFMKSSDGMVYAYDVYIADTSGKIVPCDIYIGDTNGKPVLSHIP